MTGTAAAPGTTVSEVIGYYTAKTAAIMDRYGPGLASISTWGCCPVRRRP
jgi:hypothetical protein